MIRKVVFNADDLGASLEENAATIAIARAGIVREASLLVTTGPALDDAIRSLAESKLELGVGLHFSLTLGRAVSGPMPGLTSDDGRFGSLPSLVTRSLARSIDATLVERELRAQLDLMRSLGFRPTHLNGHHHVHVFPRIREAVLRVLRDFPGLHVRVPLERPLVTASPRRVLIAAFAAGFLIRASAELVDFRRLPFVGLGLFDEIEHASAFETLARQLPTPVAEWMVHPRPEEVRTLVDRKTRELLAELEIEPSRYSDLVESFTGVASAGSTGARS